MQNHDYDQDKTPDSKSVKEAVEMMLREKQGYVMRDDVRAAMENSLEQFDELYKRLAQ